VLLRQLLEQHARARRMAHAFADDTVEDSHGVRAYAACPSPVEPARRSRL
jgi:hypothetical protein